MGKDVGVVYILTNPSFPEYVKIGYADDMEQRLLQLNRSECIPFAFQVYATYDVGHRLADISLHKIIDRLSPNLRAIETFNGKRRAREFYAMSPEDAYALLEGIAMMHGRADKLKRYDDVPRSVPVQHTEYSPTPPRVEPEQKSKSVRQTTETGRAKVFRFSMCNIPVGAELEYWCEGDVNSGLKCYVLDDRHVKYEDMTWSLSSLAAMLQGGKTAIQGTKYFKYRGEWLNDIRKRLGV